MKKTQFLTAFLVLASSASVLTSCKNEKSEIPTPVHLKECTMAEFVNNNGAKKQAFTVNVDHDTAKVVGEKGTTVTFPEDAFVTANGQPVTGNINIQLVEIYDQAEMVLSDRPTTSDGKLLISGGEIFIGATADGQELQLKENTSILITLPSDSVNQDMTLFTATTESNNQFNWKEVPNVVTTQAPTGSADSSWVYNGEPYFYYNPSLYIFSISSLGWINCDRFYDNPNITDISITCSGVVDQTNTRAYLVYKNLNSVSQLWSSTPGIFTGTYIPVGEPLTIVVFCLKDGKEYIGMQDATVSNSLSVTVQMNEASEEEILAMIRSGLN